MENREKKPEAGPAGGEGLYPFPNAEILFLYDAKDTNPNGDPDAENRPRMDHAGRRLLVSDVRLKRYVRDYLLLQGHDVWVRLGGDGAHLSADQRRVELEEIYHQQKGTKVKADKGGLDPEFARWLLSRLPDVRLFGAVFPIKGSGKKGSGGSDSRTGPVQFDWGYSLHPVEVHGHGISSIFTGREEKGEYGTLGRDYRVPYALIAFWGRISRESARTLYGEAFGSDEEAAQKGREDLDLLEKGLLEGLLEGSTTRSKVGQTPRLYLRIEWKDGFKPLGDPRDGLLLRPREGLREEEIRKVSDYTLDARGLCQALERYKGAIARIRGWRHPDLVVEGWECLRNPTGGWVFEEVAF